MISARALAHPFRSTTGGATRLSILVVVTALALATLPAASAHAEPSLAQVEKQVAVLTDKMQLATEQYNQARLALAASKAKVAALEPKIRELCARSLDPLVGLGGFDFVADLGAQMPMRVIGMLLGVPEEDQQAIRDRVDQNLRTEAGQPMDVQASFADGDQFAEAEAGRDYLAGSGIPDEALLAVPEGVDTLESIRAVSTSFDERGWSRAVLVSDPWHAMRAERMAEDALRPDPAPAG